MSKMSPRKCDFSIRKYAYKDNIDAIAFGDTMTMAFPCENFPVINESSFYLGMIIIDPSYQGEKVSEFDCKHSSISAILFISQSHNWFYSQW